MIKRLGIVLSAGGGAFEATARIVGPDHCTFSVVTDRECGGEEVARKIGADLTRITAKDKTLTSKKIAETLYNNQVDCCLLYYDKLVTKELYETIKTFNIHPSALPAFPGLTGVEDAHGWRARILGCSLHEVDHTVDGGPLIAQIACGVDPEWSLATWQKRAYLMKVYCSLVWVAKITSTTCDADVPVNASHGLPRKWLNEFVNLQRAEMSEVV